MKTLGIFGSTGSIGVNVLEVARNHPDRFRITCLTANRNAALLAEQALEFMPEAVCLCGNDGLEVLKGKLSKTGIKILSGSENLAVLAREGNFEMMVGAMVGFVGLVPTLEAIKAGKHIGLANKETLVVAGQLVNTELKEHGVQLIPIDSEHSALFQCLVGEDIAAVRKIILTASGGPFWQTPKEEFETITPARALKHPNWNMGAKITIDSATLMNKGLEVIEAHWLFGLPPEKIDVVIHPQSVIHSMVEFVDGSTKAQMGMPDMKVPIQYALTYPERLKSNFDSFDFRRHSRFDFFEPDRKKFRCLQLAFDALATMGTMPAVLNAANEVLVERFLKEIIKFTDIPHTIEHVMQKHSVKSNPSLDDLMEADRWARAMVREQLQSH